MTRKHFEAIAAQVRHSRTTAESPAERDGVDRLALNLSATFAEFNPNFDVARFLTACGF